MRKLTGLMVLIVLLCINASAQTYNYAEALQKSLYFYDANKCGNEVAGGRLLYRSNCHVTDAVMPLNSTKTNMSDAFIEQYRSILDPDGNGTLDLAGGYHDAGDHVQFGLPQTYSSSTLEWAMYEFKDAFVDIGEYDHMMELLRWASDYYLKCTFRDASGDIVAFCYQVGEGSIDHNEWSPPELIDTDALPRPAYFATVEAPASDQCAGAAASLAISYLNNMDADPAYATECLEVAEALYAFGVENRGIGYDGGFYNSSFDDDELSWAAVWLYIATGIESYLTDITSQDAEGMYTGWLGKIIRSSQDDWQNIWVHSWDTKWAGVFAKLAPITDDPFHWWIFRWNLEYWSGVPHENTNDGTYLAKTPDGFSYLSTWGSARYNAAAQMQGMVYKKYADDRFDAWMTDQINYIMGDNPLGRSYIVGYGENHAEHPHHRAAHGSPSNSMFDPVEHKHMLWGALVGGPGPDDEHNDETRDFIYNEVAIDYNAGLVGALAGHYYYFGEGHQPIADFPTPDAPLIEYSIEAKMHEEDEQRSQLSIQVMNESAFPPRREVLIKARYFFNISELFEFGQDISDVTFAIYYDQNDVQGDPVTATGPFAYDADNGIYYMDFNWPESGFYGKREYQFGLIATQDDINYEAHWDGSNDFSREGLTSEYTYTNNIQLWADGVLISGEEPGDIIIDEEPVVLFTATPTSGDVPLTVAFDASDSYDPEGNTLSYSWNFGDASTGSGEVVSHIYSTSGIYNATLTVSDGVNSVQKTTVVAALEGCSENLVPVAAISASALSGSAPLTVSFDGSASSDSDGDELAYSWDFDNESTSSDVIADATFSSAGDYNVTLTVTDQRCFASSSASVIVTVEAATVPCDDPTTISMPFSYFGAGDYCWVTSEDIAYVNSWNLEKLEINGADYTNEWSNSLPARINGNYYFVFSSQFTWAHFETGLILKDAASVNSLMANDITIYPNPFSSSVNIQFANEVLVEKVEIYNLLGRVVMHYDINSVVSELLVGEELSSGVYFIKVKTNNSVHTSFINKN